MTLGMIDPVRREKPSRSASLMACLSTARFAASRTRRSCHGDLGFHCSGNSTHQAAGAMTFASLSVGPESHGLAPESILADLLDVLLGNDPGRAGRRGGVEHEEVGPRRVEHEAN